MPCGFLFFFISFQETVSKIRHLCCFSSESWEMREVLHIPKYCEVQWAISWGPLRKKKDYLRFALFRNLLAPDHRGQEWASMSNKDRFGISSLNECLYSRRYQEHLPWTIRSETCCSDFRVTSGHDRIERLSYWLLEIGEISSQLKITWMDQ